MMDLDLLLRTFCHNSIAILSDTLSGIYLHGSAAMGCYHPQISDVDLILVIHADLTKETKISFLDMVMELNRHAPMKGIELSIVQEKYCNPFVYPTPFELHFSPAHMDWYQNDPEDYVEKMNGTDPDLAAHFTILYHRGRRLYGKEIREAFAQVPSEDYLDSIRNDVVGAHDEILKDPMYMTLNLCRVLAFQNDGLILSKAEGGLWGLEHLPHEYHALITLALTQYQTGQKFKAEDDILKNYANFCLSAIASQTKNKPRL